MKTIPWCSFAPYQTKNYKEGIRACVHLRDLGRFIVHGLLWSGAKDVQIKTCCNVDFCLVAKRPKLSSLLLFYKEPSRLLHCFSALNRELVESHPGNSCEGEKAWDMCLLFCSNFFGWNAFLLSLIPFPIHSSLQLISVVACQTLRTRTSGHLMTR